MRSYYDQNIRILPTTYPLKSPSPDFKNRNNIQPTHSPNQFNMKKSMSINMQQSHLTPVNNKSKKKSYLEYSTLPQQQIQIQNQKDSAQNFSELFQKAEKRIYNQTDTFQKPYSSTHTKNYSQQGLIQQYYPQSVIFQNKNDLMQTTGKKMDSSSHSPYMNQKTRRPTLRQDQLAKIIQQKMKSIQQKDTIISQLKQMIKLMTQNGRHLKHSQTSIKQEDYQNMKKEVKILTIENQKLLEVIDKLKDQNQKLSSNRTHPSHSYSVNPTPNQPIPFKYKDSQYSSQDEPQDQSSFQKDKFTNFSPQKISRLHQEISELKQKISDKEIAYEKQIDQLIQSHKSLAIECKAYQTEKQRFSKENERLINLLKLKQKQKQTCYNNYSYIDKSQPQVGSNPNENQSNFPNQQNLSKKLFPYHSSSQSSNKLSIQKIKSQYQQNLKQYQQNVYNEINNLLDTVNSTLFQMNQKMNAYEEKIEKLESFRSKYLNKKHKEEVVSHLTSVQVESSNMDEEEGIESRKSAIYIQEAPSTQRIDSPKSGQALSVILQQSRRDNSKLQTQLSHLRRQVQQYRQKVIILQQGQSSKLQQSELKPDESQQKLTQIYQQKILELQSLVDQLRQQKEQKEKELIELQCQILKNQENKLAEMRFEKLHKKIISSQSEQSKQKILSYKDNTPQSIKVNLNIGVDADSDGSSTQQQPAPSSKNPDHIITQLKSQLQQKTLQQLKMKQMMRDMQNALDIRQKQLFGQIENLQQLIKQTQTIFEEHKQETNQKIEDYQSKIQDLQRQNQAIKQQFQKQKQSQIVRERNFKQQLEQNQRTIQGSERKLQKLSESLSEVDERYQSQINKIQRQKDEVQKQKSILVMQIKQRELEIQNSFKKIQLLKINNDRLVNLIKERFKQQGLVFQTIKQQTSLIQTQFINNFNQLKQQNSQENQKLAQEIHTLKGQVYQFERQKIQLLQKITILQKSIQTYKRQLQQQNKFRQQLISSKNLHSQQLTYNKHSSQSPQNPPSNKARTKKNRIQQIINDQKNKINNFIKLIKQIQNQQQQE